jgi:hypothetical protein
MKALLAAAWLAAPASAWDVNQPALWQERFFWDALLQSRDRLARQQSDPNLVPMMKAVAGQVAQQVANLQQIDEYVKAQQENLKYAFEQDDPKPSLDTILANFDTLAKGNDQVRQNLYFLTVRCRMASTQALPDQDIYNAALLILGQVQQLQLVLNSLYLNTLASRNIVQENRWGADKNFRHNTEELLRSAARIQDSVFSIYNAGYELAMRSK